MTVIESYYPGISVLGTKPPVECEVSLVGFPPNASILELSETASDMHKTEVSRQLENLVKPQLTIHSLHTTNIQHKPYGVTLYLA
jgi:hypothetical protein